MAAFKRRTQIQWASKAEVVNLVNDLAEAWEANKLTEAKVIAKATTLVEDAANGEFKIDGKNVYATALIKALQAQGIEIPRVESSVKRTTTDLSKYC